MILVALNLVFTEGSLVGTVFLLHFAEPFKLFLLVIQLGSSLINPVLLQEET